MTASAADLRQPVLLEPKNFTSLQQTPWAGKALAHGIKSKFATSNQAIGESWEFSCDPKAPSYVHQHLHVTLESLIAANPSDALSPQLYNAGRTHCDILVKLLNPDAPLSLQIHPSDTHPALKPHESGKPESWLILDAKPGAGLYLGFSKEMTLAHIEAHLKASTFLPEWLQFVPVTKGDYFEIEPGVPHAIGPGLVILEPQRIMPQKSGVTWRLWDWNRKYNAEGREDSAHGKPRALHIQESLTILHPSKQIGAAYVDTLRRHAKVHEIRDGARVHIYPANSYYQVLTLNLEPRQSVSLLAGCGYAALTTLEGNLRLRAPHNRKDDATSLPQGQSAFLPWRCLPLEIQATDGPTASECTLIIPAGNGVTVHSGNVFA